MDILTPLLIILLTGVSILNYQYPLSWSTFAMLNQSHYSLMGTLLLSGTVIGVLLSVLSFPLPPDKSKKGGKSAKTKKQKKKGKDKSSPASSSKTSSPNKQKTLKHSSNVQNESFGDDQDDSYKMILCVRQDLKMKTGKKCAQCGHAVLGAYRRMIKNPNFQTSLDRWTDDGQAKIAVKIQSEEQLDSLQAQARGLNLNTYVVHDAGRTQIAPNSKTVLAIGPAPSSVVDTITRHLSLL